MAKKGQTCQTCNAACCRQYIVYYGGNVPEKFRLSQNVCRHRSVKYLKSIGYVEDIIHMEYELTCPKLTPTGKCQLHGIRKPKICSSYWCYGKLWKAKEKNE